MPRVITIMQKCVEHQIQDCFIRKLHFNDLYLLLLSIDIANIKQYLNQKKKAENLKTGRPTIVDIPQNNAIKLLKGGKM